MTYYVSSGTIKSYTLSPEFLNLAGSQSRPCPEMLNMAGSGLWMGSRDLDRDGSGSDLIDYLVFLCLTWLKFPLLLVMCILCIICLVIIQRFELYIYYLITVNPLKGRGVNWLHFAIQV